MLSSKQLTMPDDSTAQVLPGFIASVKESVRPAIVVGLGPAGLLPVPPQQARLPFPRLAQLQRSWVRMLRPPMPVLPGTPLTVLGTEAKLVVPLPSWPDVLFPQQRPVKLMASTAQVCVLPVTTSKASFKPNTAVSAIGR